MDWRNALILALVVACLLWLLNAGRKKLDIYDEPLSESKQEDEKAEDRKKVDRASAEREAIEESAREQVQHETRERFERENLELQAIEKAEQERAERQDVERAAREQVERPVVEDRRIVNRPEEILQETSRTEFDLNSPLPFQQRVLLEASAGTGKTFSLTSLVARYVAEEGLKIDQLLMATFTKAAASEMRERTRAKLSEALIALNSGISPEQVKPEDAWMKQIVDCSGQARVLRSSRLRDAISGVDSATITTIHGFFQQALREVGLRSADSANSEIAPGKNSIAKQILRDELVTLFASGDVNLMNGLPGKTPSDLEAAIYEVIEGLDSNISAVAAPANDDGTEAFDTTGCFWNNKF